MTSASWLALVLTVSGLVKLAPDDPKVVDHVEPTFGIVATNGAQLAVAETPAITVTVSLVAPVPPVQYIVKVQTPAATVWVGRFVNPHVEVTPADWIVQAVARVPIVWSRAPAVQPGAVPLPWR
jgi:hypothetical protein